MLKLCRVTKVKVLFLVLVYVFNSNLLEFSAAILEKGLLRLRQTADGRTDHVTMFTLHLPLAVFSFSVKLRSFALASKTRIILHSFFKKT